ncbi:ABC transporter ATP-binding protein [Taibaiella lutea]|uniref:ABC transporter ATP-binding protein n=1 Tax=Taibaiella lutea TaxID=2608001 RepID=A0A5M6CP52_9BACT|nr:ABC transporter ATP-binding protein [Taibaiella lutea]KAA5536924.1 ABC transporter ATP-binding protein [Taibaiella lutea]
MQHLSVLNKYFVKYRWRLLSGLLFVILANVFAVLSPQIVRETLDQVYQNISTYHLLANTPEAAALRSKVMHLVMIAGMYLLAYALLRGIFMFFMRQTIIVMSRHIEYDQKNEIYDQYQKLSTSFYKSNATGDLMSRISEDVSRVRMYTGPAIMYIINLVALICLCLWKMISVSPSMTFYVVAPLPFLAFSIFYVNKIVNRKGEKIQAELSALTSQAQESYSGIRVIKSFVRELNSIKLFSIVSQSYRKSTINLSLTESIYFPSMNLFIGLSMLLTVLVGGMQAIDGSITPGNIAEFVIYINMLMFPISAIGWTANMIQRASVSQRRINEFLDAKPEIVNSPDAVTKELKGKVEFRDVTFIYPHTGIVALKNFSLLIQPGEQIAVIGKTGSGKSTLVHLLLRMYDVTEGEILVDDLPIKKWDLSGLRHQMSYVPQDVFLFSDSIANNISMGHPDRNHDLIQEAARMAHIDKEVRELPQGYETITGERGVMLSGGQKQRISLARAIIKNPALLILDESLSAVDATTEQAIQQNLGKIHHKKTAIVITHRIFKSWNFDKIIVLEDGQILEAGNHDELMGKNGQYAKLFNYQTLSDE